MKKIEFYSTILTLGRVSKLPLLSLNRMVLMLLVSFLTIVSGSACSNDNVMPEPDNDNKVNEGAGGAYFGGKKVLVAYFSWSGTTQRMAQQIQDITGADMFRIEPVTPYPTEYTPCTEVAREEKDNNARPAIKGTVENWDDYDVVFIGCPVWWWTTPMIIHTFCESYNFKGKTVVPFCTYASTYRDETLAEIVNSTPDAAHLTGEGLTSGRISRETIQTWIDLINQEWTNNNSTPGNGDTAMSGVVNLWERGNIPTVTQNVNNSDGPDFIPNMEVFTVADNVTPKGAVIICPGGAFQFRSVQSEGYDVANMLVPMGYQCFVVNYRIAPYTMRESATDLQRAIRYVRAHADDYRIEPENIALVGFSAGGILNGEVLLNWRDLTNGTALDNSYRPDELDNIPVSACAVGMIYSFYGRLSVSMNNVETLRAANLPPAFYCWGTRDGFAGQFTQNSNAVREAGCEVETLVLDGYPHGYGTGDNASVWGERFDAFLTRIMSGNSTAISQARQDASADGGVREIYDINGRKRTSLSDTPHGVYIVKDTNGSRKLLK